MLLEYLEDPDGQVDKRVLLLYEIVTDEVSALRGAIDRLSRGKSGDELQVQALPDVVAVDGTSLAATVGDLTSAWSRSRALTVSFAARSLLAAGNGCAGCWSRSFVATAMASSTSRKRVRWSGSSPATEAGSDSDDGTPAGHETRRQHD